MNVVRRLSVVTLLAVASVLPLFPSSPAPSAVAPAHAAEISRPSATRAATPARWWGVAGAVVCGVAIKVAKTLGPIPAVLAAGIAGCALAALDVTSTKE